MDKMKKIKLDALDKVFSQYLRLLSGGYCKRCWYLKKPNAYKGYNHLQVAHFQGRVDKSTRWYPDNVAVLCAGCHSYLDAHPLQKTEFFMEILGTKRYNKLIEKNRDLTKVDKESLLEEYKEKIKKLEG